MSATTIIDAAFASPQCYVNVFPYEGGQFSIVGGAVLECTYSKNIYSNDGRFEIVLAPGGPHTNRGATWAEIITPMSFVLIGMSRGIGTETIVCAGVVTEIAESQRWETGRPTKRVTTIAGADFSYFFKNFSYTSLYYLGAAGATIGISELGLPDILIGKKDGPPDQFGKAFYTALMAGASGIMADTYVNYNSQPVTFPQAVATTFEPYGDNIIIPYGELYISSSSNWEAKFKGSIFPFPFYEFFTTTAPSGFYSSYAGSASGFAFQMPQFQGDVSASPSLVARTNPLPYVNVSVDGGGNAAFSGINTDAWDALPTYQISYGVPVESNISYDGSGTMNFDFMNPTFASSMLGSSASSTASFSWLFPGAVDATSIHRYGYKPMMFPTAWYYDPQASYVQNQGNDFAAMHLSLLGRLFSYYTPVPMMARGSVSHWLRPDILPGCKYRFTPFKQSEPWDFYIIGVEHRFVFGGPSMTTLTLDRGLPTAIYGDNTTAGVLYNMHIGNAMRQNGEYVVGLPVSGQKPLQILNPLNQVGTQQILGEIAQVYVTAQAL